MQCPLLNNYFLELISLQDKVNTAWKPKRGHVFKVEVFRLFSFVFWSCLLFLFVLVFFGFLLSRLCEDEKARWKWWFCCPSVVTPSPYLRPFLSVTVFFVPISLTDWTVDIEYVGRHSESRDSIYLTKRRVADYSALGEDDALLMFFFFTFVHGGFKTCDILSIKSPKQKCF